MSYGQGDVLSGRLSTGLNAEHQGATNYVAQPSHANSRIPAPSRAEGMTRVDRLALSDDASRSYAAQGNEVCARRKWSRDDMTDV